MPSLPGWRTACAAALALASCVVVARAQALELAGSFRMSGGVCHTLRVSPDGDLLASGGDAGEVLLYELPSGDLSRRLVAGDDQIGAVCFSSDGGRLAAAGEKLVVFDLADGAELHRSDCGNPVALDWSLDGARLCVVRRKGLAELLDGDTYRVIAKLPLGDIVSADAVAFDRRSQRVAVGTRRGRIRVFDAASGESVDEVVQPGWVRDLCWLDDGRLLAMGWDGVLRGLGDDRRLGRFGLSVDATPDGRIVLARSGQDLLRID
ncbi:MAG: WD40 repeat domain-containing protein, partial [Planctomycetes bacterium]|nr:WD40 repeat domain-containing protein [Planctomycetota bacterium]